jgi:SPP1 gp7 family putative phage head morphogenesis protein
MLMPTWRQLFAQLRGGKADNETTPPVPKRALTLAAIRRASEVAAAGYRPNVDLGAIAQPIVTYSTKAANAAIKAAGGRVQGIDATRGKAAQIQVWTRENAKLIQSIPGEALDKLADRVAKHVTDGTRIETIAKLIEDEFGPNVHTGAAARAMLIARTETAKLNASIARDSMQASGATGYVWSTADDERVREGHSLLDGEPFTWDAPPVTDERTGARNHPGEDFQCFLPGTMVSGDFVAAIVSPYRGQAVEVETAGGRRLRVTPNHPVLTPSGFRAAKVLQEGDEVLCRHLEAVRGPDTVDPHDRPSRVEQAVEFLGRSLARRPARVAPHHLHGDAVYVVGDVDVVAPERHLPNASAPDDDGDLVLKAPDMGSVSGPTAGDAFLVDVASWLAANRIPGAGALALDGGTVQLECGPLEPFGAGLVARRDAGTPEHADDGSSGHAVPCGDGQHRSATPKGRQDVGVEVGRKVGPVALGTLDERHAPRGESTEHGVQADAGILRERRSGLPAGVAVDVIIHVRKLDHVGHVFDLQTTSGLLVADGIISSNCRCVALPLYDKLPDEADLDAEIADIFANG